MVSFSFGFYQSYFYFLHYALQFARFQWSLIFAFPKPVICYIYAPHIGKILQTSKISPSAQVGIGVLLCYALGLGLAWRQICFVVIQHDFDQDYHHLCGSRLDDGV